MKRLCIATSTRADWGILTPLAVALRDCGKLKLQILATNMHLLESRGHTVDQIEADGFTFDARVPMPDEGDSPLSRAQAMAACLEGSAKALTELKPDALLILGDRYEMLAIASASTLLGIPIIHLHGGEITEGAFDDSIRHAITKLATLHLTSTEPYRQRVIQMGEQPQMVVNTGSLGVWNMMNQPRISREELCEELGFSPEKKFCIATFHPATLDPESPALRCRAMLDALDKYPDIHVIATYPNNDPGGDAIIAELKAWAEANPQRVTLVKSLGMHRFMSAVAEAEFVIGNSSSGIIEVSATGVPAINIGIRQRGRLHGPLVIDCGDDSQQIDEAIRKALDHDFLTEARRGENPYYKSDSVQIALDSILQFMNSLPRGPKTFHDIAL